MRLTRCKSIACVEVGYDNLFEVLSDADGQIIFAGHGDDNGSDVEHSDGTVDCDGMTTVEFATMILNWYPPERYAEVIADVVEQLTRR